MPTVDEVQAKVQRILQSKDLKLELRGGAIWVPYMSTTCNITVNKLGNDKTVVMLSAVVLRDVKVTSKLKEYVGSRSADFIFGNLALLHDQGQKEGILLFRHSILGDVLDEEELLNSLAMVVSTADNLDEELQKKFGGKRFVD